MSLLIFLPRHGYAQSSGTAEARATEQVSAQRTQEAGEDHWKFRWNDYPSLLLWNGTHVDFHLRMQGDLRSSDAPLDEGSPNDAARRRIGIAGDIAHHVRFELERELSGDDPWRDVYLDYRQFTIVRLQAGKFKQPFSLDENTSATKLDFVNRSMVADALAPGRDRGVMVHGRPFGRIFKYELGVFEHDGANARTDNPHRVRGERTLAARVTLRPFRGTKSRAGDLQIGVATTRSDLAEGLSSLRGRSVFGERFYRADALVNGNRQRVGLELAWDLRPVAVKAEYIRLTDTRLGQSVENTDLSPLLATGWYVSGIWMAVDRKPRFGSLELAARVEALEFNNASLQGTASASPRADVLPGSRDSALTVGVNWSPIKWFRIQANLIREVIADPNRAPSPTPFWSQVVRFQLAI